MLAAPVGIEAVAEGHVRTVVLGDDAAGVVPEELGGRMLQALQVVLIVLDLLQVGLGEGQAEVVGRVGV